MDTKTHAGADPHIEARAKGSTTKEILSYTKKKQRRAAVAGRRPPVQGEFLPHHALHLLLAGRLLRSTAERAQRHGPRLWLQVLGRGARGSADV